MKFLKLKFFGLREETQKTVLFKKLFLFFIFGTLIPILLISSISYFSARSILQAKAIERLNALNEAKLSQTDLFLDKIKIRVSDWSSDGKIRNLTEEIATGKCPDLAEFKNCPAIIDLSTHLKDKKLPLDSTILIADILDANGFIIASSDQNRIGQNEGEKDIESFEKAKLNRFGEALFANKLIFENNGALNNPMIHALSPLFSLETEQFTGVLLIHISNEELNRLFESVSGETLETYLVNPDKLMITPSRFAVESVLKQQVDTMPARACFAEMNNFQGTYFNYRGKEALGVSRCIPDKFGVLITEIETSEAFLSVNILRNITLFSLAIILTIIVIFGFFTGKKIMPSPVAAPTIITTPVITIIAFIIVALGIGIGLFFANAINQFALQLKINSMTNRIGSAVKEYKINFPPVFDEWQKSENQKKISAFGKILNTAEIGRINIFNQQGILIWTTQSNPALIGSRVEADNTTNALKGEIISLTGVSEEAKKIGLDLENFLEIYVPVFDENKNIIGVIEFYSDISDLTDFAGRLRLFVFGSTFFAIIAIAAFLFAIFQKQNKQVIVQSKELLNIIEKSPHGIFVIDKNGIIESFNPKIAEMMGIKKPEEVIGLNALEFPIYKEIGLYQFLINGLKGKPFDVEIHFGSYAGQKEIYHHYFGAPIFSQDNKSVERLLLMAEDVSERKKMEFRLAGYAKELEIKVAERTADLENRTQELNSVISSMQEGLLVIDQNRKIFLINSVAEKLLEIPANEAIGKTAEEIFVVFKDNRQIAAEESLISAVFESQAPLFISLGDKFFLKNASGKKFPLALAAAPLKTSHGIGSVIVFRDISREEEIDRAKSEFVSLASHQLRTPPTIINWHAEALISETLGKINEKQKSYLEEIYGTNRRMIELINALLNVSRIELGTFLIERKPTNLIEIAKITLNDFKKQIEEKNLEVNEKYEKDLPVIQADPNLINIIFQNLLSNAIKYTPEKGKIDFEIIKNGSNVLIKVSDTGCGIPESNQVKMFTKFFRADNAKEIDPNGTGLGLYIVKSVLEHSEGKIWFESKENQGTVFYVSMPLEGMKEKPGEKQLT